MDFNDDDIRALAHEMWEQAGCPDGMEQGFWFAAERTLAERRNKEVSREEAEASSLATVGGLVVR
jgi:hypothetical protein